MSIIVALLGLIPSVFVTGANIIFFGPFYGFCISLLGEVVGGWISFKVYRKGTKKLVSSIEGKYRLVDNILNSDGKKLGFLIFEGRLLPFVPSGIITLAASMSSVNDLTFIVATFLGKIPSILLEVLISYGVIVASQGNVKIIIGIIGILLIYFTFKKIK